MKSNKSEMGTFVLGDGQSRLAMERAPGAGPRQRGRRGATARRPSGSFHRLPGGAVVCWDDSLQRVGWNLV